MCLVVCAFSAKGLEHPLRRVRLPLIQERRGHDQRLLAGPRQCGPDLACQCLGLGTPVVRVTEGEQERCAHHLCRPGPVF